MGMLRFVFNANFLTIWFIQNCLTMNTYESKPKQRKIKRRGNELKFKEVVNLK